jgi:ribokinase
METQMKILTFGSLNIDHVYRVGHFVCPGETLSSESYEQFCGGKGFNQSIALANAGADVFHAGMVGNDGTWLRARLDKSGVDASLVGKTDKPTGHAIIQVNADGEYCIIIHGGANQCITEDYIDRVLSNFSPGDFILLQNEVNGIPEIIRRSAKLDLKIIFNPAPMDADVLTYPLDLVNCFILNEIEGKALSGKDEPEEILLSMIDKYPKAETVLTLGEKGVLFGNSERRLAVPAIRVKPADIIDTTAAGDTFIGYFLEGYINNQEIETALRTACRSASICITRSGAADAIPKREEVEGMAGV